MTQNLAQHFHISGDGENSALELLHQHTQLSKQQIKQAAIKGAIWLSQGFDNSKNKAKHKPERVRRLKKILSPNQSIDFYYNADLLNTESPPAKLLADFKDYSVWIKPRGMLSQGSKWADHTALYRWVELYFQTQKAPRPCWIVHRLDRATQGIMLLAHNKKTAAALSHAFEKHQIQKRYLAIVHGQFPTNKITIETAIDDKKAISHVFNKQYHATFDLSLVEVNIETGRKHQIRKHLSEEGFPIVGDRLHGNPEKDLKLNQLLEFVPDLQLSAYKLSFECPITLSFKEFELAKAEYDLLSQSYPLGWL